MATIHHDEKQYLLFRDLEHAVPQPCTLDGISMNIKLRPLLPEAK